jgi:hypothetical protein
VSEVDSRPAYPCRSCGKVIELRRFGRRPLYCTARCRTAAFRQAGMPRETEAFAQWTKSPTCPIEIIGELDRLSLQTRATAPQSYLGSPEAGQGLLPAPATFVTESPKARAGSADAPPERIGLDGKTYTTMPTRPRIGRPPRRPKAIPDSTYPGMWRAHWPDGRVSDLANISRVNDAIANFLERA